ncbi:MAG: deoxyribose-phosphate aldolase [Hyphomicrobiales bacterium]
MLEFDNYTYTEESIKDRINKILKEELPKANKTELLKKALGFIDLTTLEGEDHDAKVVNLCKKGMDYKDDTKGIPEVAAICVYPPFAKLVKETVKNTDINVACVAGAFPAGQSPIEIKVAEVEWTVAQGADDIDMVISRGKFLEGKYEEVGEEVAAIKKACGSAHLKVILETGELKTPQAIRKASELAINYGGDFIKTSTGKIPVAATLEASVVMMDTIKEYYEKTGRMIGFKPAGGIADANQAVEYLVVLQSILGEKWMNKEYFRIGASRLADKIYNEIV